MTDNFNVKPIGISSYIPVANLFTGVKDTNELTQLLEEAVERDDSREVVSICNNQFKVLKKKQNVTALVNVLGGAVLGLTNPAGLLVSAAGVVYYCFQSIFNQNVEDLRNSQPN